MLNALFSNFKRKKKTKQTTLQKPYKPDFQQDPGFGLCFSFLANSSALQALKLALEVAL